MCSVEEDDILEIGCDESLNISLSDEEEKELLSDPDEEKHEDKMEDSATMNTLSVTEAKGVPPVLPPPVNINKRMISLSSHKTGDERSSKLSIVKLPHKRVIGKRNPYKNGAMINDKKKDVLLARYVIKDTSSNKKSKDTRNVPKKVVKFSGNVNNKTRINLSKPPSGNRNKTAKRDLPNGDQTFDNSRGISSNPAVSPSKCHIVVVDYNHRSLDHHPQVTIESPGSHARSQVETQQDQNHSFFPSKSLLSNVLKSKDVPITFSLDHLREKSPTTGFSLSHLKV